MAGLFWAYEKKRTVHELREQNLEILDPPRSALVGVFPIWIKFDVRFVWTSADLSSPFLNTVRNS